MMLFIAIIGFMLVFLSFFSLLTARGQGARWFWQAVFLILSLALTAFAIWKLPYWNHDNNAPQQTSAQTSKSSSESISGTNSPVFSADESQTNLQTQNLKEKNVLEQLQQSYKAFGSVSFNGTTRTYVISSKNSNFNKAVAYLDKNPKKTDEVKWPTEISNMTKTGKSVNKVLGNGYTISLRKSDQKTILLNVKNGKLIYDRYAH